MDIGTVTRLLYYVLWLMDREVGPQEPTALLHERIHAEFSVPGTLQLVPRNRSFHYMKQRFPICWVQEPVDWFRGTDRFATRIVNFWNLCLRNPLTGSAEPTV